MRIGSLFSGAGGLDMAVEQVFGGEVMWQCEFNEAASKVLAYRYPDVPNFGDVTSIDWGTVEPVDVMCGGFPCQPFSAAGQRQGENDERHLWPFFVEAIRALRPKVVVLENVAGLRSIGGMFDEPPLRCVCGWIGRWGGVHFSEVQQDREGHRDPRPGGHGNQSCRDSEQDAVQLRRDVDHPDAGQSQPYGDPDVDRDRLGGCSIPEENPASPITEVRTGGGSVAYRGDSHISGAHRDSGSLPVDGRVGAAVRGSASSVERAERTWSGYLTKGWGDAVCPSCGRQLGDESGGHVFRSGMGTVLGDLAAIGYDAQWCSVRASDVGAPHRRERVFILAVDAHAARDGRAQLDDRARSTAARGGWEWDAAGSVGSAPVADPDDAAADRERSCAEPRRRGEGAAADPTRDGRDEGRTEPAGFEGRSDAAVGGHAHVALLPTPVARDNKPAGPRDVRDLAVLPTPKSSDGQRHDCAAERRRNTPSLVAIDHYLPTPSASDGTGGGQHPDQRDGHTRQLCDYALLDGSARWGKYEPAIRRWETVTRTAPSPTEPNTRGNPRLAAPFPEWMMGWPAGWVTALVALGLISRNDALRIIGNGVCPQQAIAALRWLLRIVPIGAAA